MKSMSPNLMVYNVNDTIEYYRTFLGFELLRTVPEEGNYDWARMRCGEVTVMFQTRESMNKNIPQYVDAEPGCGFALYVMVDDIQSLYNRIKENVEVVVDMNDTFYGMREFSIRDLNGYILTFAEPVIV